jgi:signal transduction histidine kinase
MNEPPEPVAGPAALHRFAAGIAHDLNNLLQLILGNADLLRADADVPEAGRGFLNQILNAGERGKSLARQLAVFSGQQPVYRQPVDLNQVLRQMEPALRLTLGDEIELRFAHANNLPLAAADLRLLEELLAALAANARAAMPSGGRSEFGTASLAVPAPAVPGPPGRRTGDYVVLWATDTGNAIPQADLPHLFEPYYTNPGLGRPLGLRWAFVHAVVQQHAGWIEVDGLPDRSTRLQLAFPVWR